MSDSFLAACRHIVGHEHVLTGSDTAPFLTDHRQRMTGRALAVISPASTEEVAAVVQACQTWQVPIVPQGGNTGLVQGSVPDTSGTAIVLSLRRMHKIRHIDKLNLTLTAEAGCILQQVQQAAADHDLLFPLSLASEGSCTIGGNLSTNAGGTGVLRYGNTRELCLGIEFVTPDGSVVSALSGLRKDNTGYDLRHLIIGAEGTLGIITAATMKLFPRPVAQMTALFALTSPEQALQLLQLAQSHCHDALTGFELISDICMQLVCRHFPQNQFPFSQHHAQYVLLELSDNTSASHAEALLTTLSEKAFLQHLVEDAVVATSVAQQEKLWQLREWISPAQAKEGKNIKHDISVPVSRIADFIRTTDCQLQQAFPGCRHVTFGHLGDGNLHYNVSPPEGEDYDKFMQQQSAINRIVHDNVDLYGGAISAEHGIGTLKRDELVRYKPPAALDFMRAIKKAIDPSNLMNPGKIL